MRTVAILPVKRFARAKQRLRKALDDGPRTRLAEAMACDVLDVLCAFEGFARVIVVTTEPVVAEHAVACGAHVVDDPDEAGQSAAAPLGVLAGRGIDAHRALHGLREIRPGDDLAALILGLDVPLHDGDVLAVAHKVVSKAEGRVIELATVSPSRRALELAAQHGKDPRHVQVVLDEAAEIVRSRPGVIICRTRHGFVCANAGVDASNAGREDALVLLPHDPDASARALRAALAEPGGGRPAGRRPPPLPRALRPR